MFEINGKYNIAKVYTDNVESSAIGQITSLCNQEIYKDSKIRIMPDVHAGAGCTIGTTMTIKDAITPNLVGVDIGCGMSVIKIEDKRIDLPKLDSVIRNEVPSGMTVHDEISHNRYDMIDLNALKCAKRVNIDYAYHSLGTLGGGNHFIEVDKDNDGNLYLVIHTGSRHLGLEVANYYQKLGWENLIDNSNPNGTLKDQSDALIERLKSEGKSKYIAQELKKLREEYSRISPKIPYELAYVSGDAMNDYIHDVKIAQSFAKLNRFLIAKKILSKMHMTEVERFETIHNYIDTDAMILRKGAVSAKENEKLIIPMNMRDGSLICVGKGNEDWNCSAPHGAGRICSRSEAKQRFSMTDFKKSMEGIYTTSVDSSTLDECPMTYKPIEEIMSNIVDTVDIVNVVKPIYNFKASE